MEEKIVYIIEFKPEGRQFYKSSFNGFFDKKLALKLADKAKKETPGMGVRLIEQKRRIIKVCC